MMPDYLHFLLTVVKKNEYTNASTTGLLNAKTRDWDYEIIERLGLKKSLFKPLFEPCEKVGGLRPEIAAEVGRLLEEKYGKLDIVYVPVNPTAGSHCGPNGVGVCFHATHR